MKIKNLFTIHYSLFTSPTSQGFTLIELLVAIAIIATIVGFLMPNYLGARQRARDVKRKTELLQLKAALRLYFNDYQKYPAWNTGLYIVGCGTNGTTQCLTGAGICTTAEFAAGGTDGCATVYMRSFPQIPPVSGTTREFRYYQVASGDDFRLKTTLENTADPDIAASQARCPVAGATNPTGTISYNASTDYVLCAD